MVHLEQDSNGVNPIPCGVKCVVKSIPWRSNRINKKRYQGAVGADCKGESVFAKVCGIILPQYEGKNCWSYEMQRIEKGSKVVQKGTPVELLKDERWDITEQSQICRYRLLDMHKAW